jgi:SAM-dependent methyltransferase
VKGVTEDASPVEVYRRLPETGEADLVASVVDPGSSILELGSGAGRVTNELTARGYAVTAVDDSAEMLASVRDAVAGRTWRQSFEADLRDENELTAELAGAGLLFAGWIDRDRGWLQARPA